MNPNIKQILLFGASLDPNAALFIKNAGITNPTQKNAINIFTQNLKSYGLWQKHYLIDLIVGGNATSHALNLLNPYNTDSAYRLLFYGGWVHNSSGMVGNATNTYADTRLNCNTVLSANSVSYGWYASSYTSTTTKRICGAVTSSSLNRTDSVTVGTTLTYSAAQDSLANFTPSSLLGYFEVNRTGSATTKFYRNGISVSSSSIVSSAQPNDNFYIGNTALSGAPFDSNYCGATFSFFKIGQGLNATEAANMYYLVQQFQTNLGRAV